MGEAKAMPLINVNGTSPAHREVRIARKSAPCAAMALLANNLAHGGFEARMAYRVSGLRL